MTLVVEKQVAPADAVLVLIDSIQTTHEHKPGAADSAESHFEWFPIRFHGSSLLRRLWLQCPRGSHLSIHSRELAFQGHQLSEFRRSRQGLPICAGEVRSRAGSCCGGEVGSARRCGCFLKNDVEPCVAGKGYDHVLGIRQGHQFLLTREADV